MRAPDSAEAWERLNAETKRAEASTKNVDAATAAVNSKAKEQAAAGAAEDAQKKKNKKTAPSASLSSAWTRDDFRRAGAEEDEKTYTDENRNLMKEDERWRKERSEMKAQMKDALDAYGKAALRAALAAVNCKAMFDHRFGPASSATTTTTAGGGGGEKQKRKRRSRGRTSSVIRSY